MVYRAAARLKIQLTCGNDVEGAGLLLLPEAVGGPAEDGAVVQLVVRTVDQLGGGAVLAEPGVLDVGQLGGIVESPAENQILRRMALTLRTSFEK